jgi:peptidoglycan/xylan/chitin deacetylase (PgdA/CDA1 family)
VKRFPASGLGARLRSRGHPAALVLCYHRIGRVETDPWLLSVSPEHFVEQLEVLRAVTDTVPIEQLPRELCESTRVRRRPLVALTFDDGYADNLYAAKPLLEAADVGATVFVVSGAVGRNREFWWDTLERALLSTDRTVEQLVLERDGARLEWRLADAPYAADADERHRGSNASYAVDPSPRHRLFRASYAALRAASEDERSAAISALLERGDAAPRESHRPLSEQELRLLAEGGLVSVGAHTVTHPVLSEIPERDQRREVEQSKEELERLLGRPVRTFAYPFGEREHYTASAVRAVRDAGFEVACTTVARLVRRRTSRFELPRFTVLDWDGDRFAQTLARWARG